MLIFIPILAALGGLVLGAVPNSKTAMETAGTPCVDPRCEREGCIGTCKAGKCTDLYNDS